MESKEKGQGMLKPEENPSMEFKNPNLVLDFNRSAPMTTRGNQVITFDTQLLDRKRREFITK